MKKILLITALFTALGLATAAAGGQMEEGQPQQTQGQQQTMSPQEHSRALEGYLENLYHANDFNRAPIDLHTFKNQPWRTSIRLFPIRPEARGWANQLKQRLDNGEDIRIMPRFSLGEGVAGINEWQIITVDDGMNFFILLGTGGM